jgi:hypothetical protein
MELKLFLIPLLIILLVPSVFATDYNFYDCATNNTLGTLTNIPFGQAESNDSICINATDTQSTNFAVNVSGFLDYYSTGINFYVGGEQNNIQGVTWNGSHFWVVGESPDVAHLYYSNGTYTGINFGIPDNFLDDIVWDGSYLWALGQLADRVYRYYQNGTYANFNFSVGAQETVALGIGWNGSSLWVVGENTDTVYEYTTNGIYTGTNFSVGVQSSSPRGITWVDPHFWVAGFNSRRIYQYTSNGTYTGVNFDISEGNPQGITWDGSDLWIATFPVDRVYRYNSSLFPSNLSLDVNNDSTNEWSMSDDLNSTNSPQWTSGVPAGTITLGGMKILNFTSATEGLLQLSGINYLDRTFQNKHNRNSKRHSLRPRQHNPYLLLLQ